jgi:hypothetical protein
MKGSIMFNKSKLLLLTMLFIGTINASETQAKHEKFVIKNGSYEINVFRDETKTHINYFYLIPFTTRQFNLVFNKDDKKYIREISEISDQDKSILELEDIYIKNNSQAKIDEEFKELESEYLKQKALNQQSEQKNN